MNIISFLIAFFLLRFLRQSLQDSPLLPYWENRLFIARNLVIAILVVDVLTFTNFDTVTNWLWHLLILAIVGVAYLLEEFRSARLMLYAVALYAVLALMASIVGLWDEALYETLENYIESAGVFAVIWVIVMWRTTQKQQKALEEERQKRLQEEEHSRIIAAKKDELEAMVQERTAEITRQKEELEHALADLQATQVKLIQQEKMASLGELTAGIAHEIQNPLNFVNNLAEVSAELVAELKEERNRETRDKELEEEILTDLKDSLEKITHHGKRADSIVKGMLQHSRSSSGEKQPTDLNALVDEYLRLAYHGLRAKDKSFNADLRVNLDPNLGKIKLDPQEIGRVLLNLYNNAFYATQEKARVLANGRGTPARGTPAYQPQVSVSTQIRPAASEEDVDTVEIRVKDNGMGIPQEIINKIYQPFFTTKPTGQGTGLGLSLSYDIVTKGHGGDLSVETEPGQYSEFIIHLPCRSA
ncbi:hypothetical protein GCM10023189_13280 [Nibrella saemangeumensis]|uniref:histidine kinase n=1 Tax=Nibrella saemangeumensis TaxID=1084526 RepID=A0ABP8MJK6_9BACT